LFECIDEWEILVSTNRTRRRPAFVFMPIDPISIFEQDTMLRRTGDISERKISPIHSRKKERKTIFYRFNDHESLSVIHNKSSSLLEPRIRWSLETWIYGKRFSMKSFFISWPSSTWYINNNDSFWDIRNRYLPSSAFIT
jgi:hypothetical protein